MRAPKLSLYARQTVCRGGSGAQRVAQLRTEVHTLRATATTEDAPLLKRKETFFPGNADATADCAALQSSIEVTCGGVHQTRAERAHAVCTAYSVQKQFRPWRAWSELSCRVGPPRRNACQRSRLTLQRIPTTWPAPMAESLPTESLISASEMSRMATDMPAFTRRVAVL